MIKLDINLNSNKINRVTKLAGERLEQIRLSFEDNLIEDVNELLKSYYKFNNLKSFNLEIINNKIKTINSFKTNETVFEVKIILRNNKI